MFHHEKDDEDKKKIVWRREKNDRENNRKWTCDKKSKQKVFTNGLFFYRKRKKDSHKSNVKKSTITKKQRKIYKLYSILIKLTANKRYNEPKRIKRMWIQVFKQQTYTVHTYIHDTMKTFKSKNIL